MRSASEDRVSRSLSSRTDPRTGIRKEISFLPYRGSGIFACMHFPQGSPSTAVVICSPIGAEWMRNDRREARLADALAGRGLCAARFHYRSTGHSDGPPEELSVDSMYEDAGFIANRLLRASGATGLSFVGSRLGGMVAAAAASVTDAHSIALWEPVVNARRYFREVMRARVMSDLGKGRGGAGASEALFAELERSGCIDVLGYRSTEHFTTAHWNGASRWDQPASLGAFCSFSLAAHAASVTSIGRPQPSGVRRVTRSRSNPWAPPRRGGSFANGGNSSGHKSGSKR